MNTDRLLGSEILVLRNGHQIKPFPQKIQVFPKDARPLDRTHIWTSGFQLEEKGCLSLDPSPPVSNTIHLLFTVPFFPHALNGGNGFKLQKRGWRVNIRKVSLKFRAGSHQGGELSHKGLPLVGEI